MREKTRARHTKTAGKTTWGGGDTGQKTPGLHSDAKLSRLPMTDAISTKAIRRRCGSAINVLPTSLFGPPPHASWV